jgi:CRP-like cAMP-binding protein
VREAARGNLSMEWLKPFMNKRACHANDVLFRKGDAANEMFFTVTGRYRLRELGLEIAPGHMIGELGMITPDNRRTATFECIEDGELLAIGYGSVQQLMFQNPQFAFYFLHLATERLHRNVRRLEEQVAAQARRLGEAPA